MRIFHFLYVILILSEVYSNTLEIFPFSSIKMQNDDIYVTLDLKRSEWNKLISINNIGSDAIINFSKQHYGLSKCDYELECYKYNILKNFNEVFHLISLKDLGLTVSLEIEYKDNHKQNGVDVLSNHQKFLLNQKFFEENVKETKKHIESNNLGSTIFKGFNKLKRTFSNFFDEKNTKTLNHSSNVNLRKEIIEMKKEIKELEKEENIIESNLIKDFKNITQTINSERTLINGLYRREILAGIIGGVSVGVCVILFYVFNGLIKGKLRPLDY